MTVRVKVVSDYELIESGVRSVLQRFPERVEVVTSDATVAVDIALWSTFGVPRDATLDKVLSGHGARQVVALCWDFQPGLVERCLAAGARGYLSTRLTGEELVDSLERVHAGEVVVSQPPSHEAEPTAEPTVEPRSMPEWPGQQQGLSEREGDIVALIASGLSNNEIADQLFLSINTIKSYVRSAYQKMGVTSRSRAVLWAVEHGMRRRDNRVEQDLA